MITVQYMYGLLSDKVEVYGRSCGIFTAVREQESCGGFIGRCKIGCGSVCVGIPH